MATNPAKQEAHRPVTREMREKNHANEQQTYQERIKEQHAKELARQIQEQKDAKEHRAKLAKGDEERRKKDEATAASLKPECEHQKVVEPRLSEKTTLQLGAAIKAASNKPKQLIKWVCVSKERGRECLGRAYPLALQIGIMSTMDDKACALQLPNGSRVEFTWPDKTAA